MVFKYVNILRLLWMLSLVCMTVCQDRVRMSEVWQESVRRRFGHVTRLANLVLDIDTRKFLANQDFEFRRRAIERIGKIMEDDDFLVTDRLYKLLTTNDEGCELRHTSTTLIYEVNDLIKISNPEKNDEIQRTVKDVTEASCYRNKTIRPSFREIDKFYEVSSDDSKVLVNYISNVPDSCADNQIISNLISYKVDLLISALINTEQLLFDMMKVLTAVQKIKVLPPVDLTTIEDVSTILTNTFLDGLIRQGLLSCPEISTRPTTTVQRVTSTPRDLFSTFSESILTRTTIGETTVATSSSHSSNQPGEPTKILQVPIILLSPNMTEATASIEVGLGNNNYTEAKTSIVVGLDMTDDKNISVPIFIPNTTLIIGKKPKDPNTLNNGVGSETQTNPVEDNSGSIMDSTFTTNTLPTSFNTESDSTGPDFTHPSTLKPLDIATTILNRIPSTLIIESTSLPSDREVSESTFTQEDAFSTTPDESGKYDTTKNFQNVETISSQVPPMKFLPPITDLDDKDDDKFTFGDNLNTIIPNLVEATINIIKNETFVGGITTRVPQTIGLTITARSTRPTGPPTTPNPPAESASGSLNQSLINLLGRG